MTRRALIARADNGGLANMLLPLARNVKFDKILVVFSGHTTRGTAHPERYEGLGEVRSVEALPRARDVAWATTDVDLLYTAETWYHPYFLQSASERGVRTVVHAMPELWSVHETADEVWAPTPWRLDLLPTNTKVVPVPVDRELLTYRKQDLSSLSILHVTTNAMEDREGTELLLEAASLLDFEVDIRILGLNHRHPGPKHEYRGLAHIEWVGAVDHPFWEMWRLARPTDVLVQPRRYGGLCLTMQEAAAVGIPILTLDLSPQRAHLTPFNVVATQPLGWTRMKGGSVNVMTCDPRALAKTLNGLSRTPLAVDFLADVSDRWAKALSWSNWSDEYERLLTV